MKKITKNLGEKTYFIEVYCKSFTIILYGDGSLFLGKFDIKVLSFGCNNGDFMKKMALLIKSLP